MSWTDVLNVLFYSAIGLLLFFYTRRVKKLRDEWRELKAEQKQREKEEKRLASLSDEERALEERKKAQIAAAQAAIDRHKAELEAKAAEENALFTDKYSS